MEKQNESVLNEEIELLKNGIQRMMAIFDYYIPKWLYSYYYKYPEKIQSDEDVFLFLFAKKCVKDACITLGDCEEERNSQKESRMRLDAQIWGEKIEKCEGFVEFCVKLLRMYTSAKEIGLI